MAWASILPLLVFLLQQSQAIPSPQGIGRPYAAAHNQANGWRKGMGVPTGDPPEKYFHESTFHPHYDGRFADAPLPYEQKRAHLIALAQTYFATMNDIGAQTWIMHGSLLGWWWNRRILPWDSDIDVQMSESSTRYLADYYNMTVHHYKFKESPGGRDYLLEINPNYKNESTTDKLNMIDGRWIDMSSGLFIDITTLRPNRTAEALGVHGLMMCKDKHWFWEKSIYPLRDSYFENVAVKVPHSYTELLEEEYKPISLTRTKFEGHTFDQTKMEWIPDPPQQAPIGFVGSPGAHIKNINSVPNRVVSKPGFRGSG